MTVAVIIQARLGSTRLPAKVLLPLPTGRTVLEEVIHRCKQIKGVDVVVLAIPDTAENDILDRIFPSDRMFPRWSSLCEVTVVRGPEHDVLARYVKAAEEVDASAILRITSDCPLIEPELCEQAIETWRNMPHNDVFYDYLCNNEPRTYPLGLDYELFDREALLTAHANATDPDDREHVGSWIRRRAIAYSTIAAFRDRSGENRSHIRWTLDTLEDYVRIWNEFKRREEAA